MKKIPAVFGFIVLFAAFALSQVPMPTLVKIVKAEDARRYDAELETLIKSPNPAVQKRAALAAGRIGNDEAIPVLAELLYNGASDELKGMAAFAIGEIESVKGADPILKVLGDTKTADYVRTYAVEAAGKIAAANTRDASFKPLGEAILAVLEAEDVRRPKQNRYTILMAITAALRARPADADRVTAKFLTNLDARVRADAANTLTRLRAKNANAALRAMLLSDSDPVARANAARALGAAEDKEAFDLLMTAALEDDDSRVRVSATGSLAALRDVRAADRLVTRGNTLLLRMNATSTAKKENSPEKNELLVITSTLQRLLPKSDNAAAVSFLKKLNEATGHTMSEITVALAQVSPKGFFDSYQEFNKSPRKLKTFPDDWHITVASVRGLAELAKLPADDEIRKSAFMHVNGALTTYYGINKLTPADLKKPDHLTAYIAREKMRVFDRFGKRERDVYLPVSDVLSAYAAFKPERLNEYLINFLQLDDVQTRAAAAGLLADQPHSKQNVEALQKAFAASMVRDKDSDDATLAILAALYKLDKKESVGSLLVALNSPNYLVRKRAFALLSDKGLQADSPGVPTLLENAKAKHKDLVLPYSPAFGTKLGQMMYTDADYVKALSRKNGSVSAELLTEKGRFTIHFTPEEAPLTVDNFVRLARSGYLNGVEVHRVVPNFVMQDGDPQGDGNGGPGWSIRCEVNMLMYDRGAVGMALSGKDTGGSQWFVTHSPQPHLDGGYTIFGHVNESDMKTVDNIVKGDKILTVRIIEVARPGQGLRNPSK